MYVVVTVNDEKYKSLADWTVNKNKKELSEPYVSDIRNDLSQLEESVRYNNDKWSLFC